MKAETDILGDAAVVEMATADAVDMVADAVVATIATTTTPTPTPTPTIKPNLIHLDSILLMSGISFSFEVHDKIWKEHDKKGKQGETK